MTRYSTHFALPERPSVPAPTPAREKTSNSPPPSVRVPREVEKQKIVRELHVLIDRVRKL